MSSESKALAWVANLSQQFDNFCSEADAIISQTQEPIEYIRKQFVTTGESIKQFYSELLEDALSIGFLDKCGPTSPRKEEEITELPDCKVSYISPLPTEPVGKVYENYSSKVAVVKNPEIETSDSTSKNSVQCSLVPACPEEIGNFEVGHFSPEVDEYKLQNNEVSRVTSSVSACSVEPAQTCVSGLSECIDTGDGLSECIDTGESKEPVNSDDEFCSEANRVSFQKTETLGKKFTYYRSRKIAPQDFDDDETEIKGWEKLDEDIFCDSDWEII